MIYDYNDHFWDALQNLCKSLKIFGKIRYFYPAAKLSYYWFNCDINLDY